MTFKPALWHPIAVVLSGINLVALGLAAGAAQPLHATAHAALALGFGWWARRLRQGPGGSEVARMTRQLQQQAAALEDAQTTLANQSAELAELHERVDFAERVLAQARDRPPLGNREERK